MKEVRAIIQRHVASTVVGELYDLLHFHRACEELEDVA